ncbi:MotE family protein [Primorskyibacter marinus]|uniref:MotE family protein n=1 Tax=Primorskyibacter marinus TaxID=1977320 RepID=UPI000E305117|nr:hypothetical protein [Primorskyibacter marinus]
MSRASNTTPRRRKGRGTLSIIAGLLLASGIIRLGTHATSAFAFQSAPEVASTPIEEPQVCPDNTELEEVISALKRREEKLDAREEEIARRSETLEIQQAEAEARIVSAKAEEEKLRLTMAAASSAAEDDVSQLTKVYANMKPKQAAGLFEEMDPEFAAGFLGRMAPGAAAQVMAGMTPKAAYAISVVLAGRNIGAGSK